MRDYITGRLLDRQRAMQAAMLPDRATIKRPAKTKTATGGTVDTLSDAYVDRPCEVKARVLREITERDMGGQLQSSVRWLIVFTHDTVIQLDDVIHVTPGSGGAVQVYNVVGLLSTESWDSAVGVEANRVQ